MTKFIFHGGAVGTDTSSNDLFYEELVKDLPENGIVLMVYFASRTDDNSDRIQYDTEKCKQFGPRGVQVIVATLEDFIDQIASADTIFLRGGSTEKLLTALRKYSDLKNKLVDKTIAGSSAGAYALSTFFSSHYEDSVGIGLGIAPVRVVTHYGSPTMPPRPGSVDALKLTAQELELIMLRQGEWKVFNLEQEQRTKPTILYHGSETSGIEEFEPRIRYTPGENKASSRIYATDDPAFAVAHSFPWSSDEGVDIVIKPGGIILQIPEKIKSRLNQPVCIYTFDPEFFQFTNDEITGKTYHSEIKVKPKTVLCFDSVTEAMKHFAGEIEVVP